MASRNANKAVFYVQVLVGFVLFCLVGLANLVHAQTFEAGWQYETEIYLAGITNYQATNGTSTTHDSVLTAIELKLFSDDRPWYAGVVAEYQFSNDRGFDDVVNLGGYVSANLQNWDATSVVFVSTSPGTADTWYYAAKVRFRFAENHKVGIEVFAPLAHAGSPELALGYYGSISESLSLNVIADPGFNEWSNITAKLELVWQIF